MRASCSSYQQDVSVSFIENPNLPRAPAPGIPPGGVSITTNNINQQLPKTNDSNYNLCYLGGALIYTSIVVSQLVITKRKIQINNIN